MTRTIPYSQQDFGYQKKNHWEQWRHGDITYKKPHNLRHHKIKLQVGVQFCSASWNSFHSSIIQCSLLRHRYRWATDLLCLLPFFWHLLIWLWMSKLPKSAAKPRAFCEKPRSIQIRLNKRGNTPPLICSYQLFHPRIGWRESLTGFPADFPLYKPINPLINTSQSSGQWYPAPVFGDCSGAWGPVAPQAGKVEVDDVQLIGIIAGTTEMERKCATTNQIWQICRFCPQMRPRRQKQLTMVTIK